MSYSSDRQIFRPRERVRYKSTTGTVVVEQGGNVLVRFSGGNERWINEGSLRHVKAPISRRCRICRGPHVVGSHKRRAR